MSVGPESAPSTRPKKSGEVYKDPDDGRQRFLLELEFVQLLANPNYIHYLAQNGVLEEPAFVNYLKYLRYWTRLEYVRFIMYPHALFFLELLQSAPFRAAMAHPANKELAHQQQYFFWRHYRNNRLQQLLSQGKAAAQEEGADVAPPPPVPAASSAPFSTQAPATAAPPLELPPGAAPGEGAAGRAAAPEGDGGGAGGDSQARKRARV